MNRLPHEIKVLIAESLSYQDLISLTEAIPEWSSLRHDVSFWAARAEREFQVPRGQFNLNPLDRYRQLQRTAIYSGCERYQPVLECMIQSSIQGRSDLIPYFRAQDHTRITIDGSMYERFYTAARDGDLVMLKFLLPHIKGYCSEFNFEETVSHALEKATKGGHLEIVQYLFFYLLHSGYDLDYALIRIIRQTVEHRQIPIIQFVIDNDPTRYREIHYTGFLFEAARKGALDLVKYLIDILPPRYDRQIIDALSADSRVQSYPSVVQYLRSVLHE